MAGKTFAGTQRPVFSFSSFHSSFSAHSSLPLSSVAPGDAPCALDNMHISPSWVLLAAASLSSVSAVPNTNSETPSIKHRFVKRGLEYLCDLAPATAGGACSAAVSLEQSLIFIPTDENCAQCVTNFKDSNAKTCTASAITSCLDGFLVYKGKSCVAACPDGYHPHSSNSQSACASMTCHADKHMLMLDCIRIRLRCRPRLQISSIPQCR